MNTSIKKFSREAAKDRKAAAEALLDELEPRLAAVDEDYIKAGVRSDVGEIRKHMTAGRRWEATKLFVTLVNTLDHLADGNGTLSA